jgi:hypothetical protein
MELLYYIPGVWPKTLTMHLLECCLSVEPAIALQMVEVMRYRQGTENAIDGNLFESFVLTVLVGYRLQTLSACQSAESQASSPSTPIKRWQRVSWILHNTPHYSWGQYLQVLVGVFQTYSMPPDTLYCMLVMALSLCRQDAASAPAYLDLMSDALVQLAEHLAHAPSRESMGICEPVMIQVLRSYPDITTQLMTRLAKTHADRLAATVQLVFNLQPSAWLPDTNVTSLLYRIQQLAC